MKLFKSAMSMVWVLVKFGLWVWLFSMPGALVIYLFGYWDIFLEEQQNNVLMRLVSALIGAATYGLAIWVMSSRWRDYSGRLERLGLSMQRANHHHMQIGFWLGVLPVFGFYALLLSQGWLTEKGVPASQIDLPVVGTALLSIIILAGAQTIFTLSLLLQRFRELGPTWLSCTVISVLSSAGILYYGFYPFLVINTFIITVLLCIATLHLRSVWPALVYQVSSMATCIALDFKWLGLDLENHLLVNTTIQAPAWLSGGEAVFGDSALITAVLLPVLVWAIQKYGWEPKQQQASVEALLVED